MATRRNPASNTVSRFSKSIPLIKGLDKQDERFVLGIVLEPEVVDAQGDVYSVEEIRGAAHRFMEEFGGLGLMHRLCVNGKLFEHGVEIPLGGFSERVKLYGNRGHS